MLNVLQDSIEDATVHKYIIRWIYETTILLHKCMQNVFTYVSKSYNEHICSLSEFPKFT